MVGLHIRFYNPIKNDDVILCIPYPNIDYFTWKHLKDYKDDKDLINILDDILRFLDCRNETSVGRICMTTFPIYGIKMQEFYYYLDKIRNQFIYNEYINKLIELHVVNLIFEHDYPYIKTDNKDKTPKKRKYTANKFYRNITHDLFTNETVYVYINPKTGEEIQSKNPDLLEELNAPKPKKKRSSRITIPINNMTFDFNINKKE